MFPKHAKITIMDRLAIRIPRSKLVDSCSDVMVAWGDSLLCGKKRYPDKFLQGATQVWADFSWKCRIVPKIEISKEESITKCL